MSKTQITRKQFLKTSAFSSLLLGSGIFIPSGCTEVKRRGEAKNVIILVSDGMSAATLQMADTMLKRNEGRTSNWIRLYEEGKAKRSLMDMASANRLVTGSAAASSAWGAGKRVNNGALNIGPNGEVNKPIIPIFKEAGKATGVVTTTEVTHATPAGFISNMEQRGMQEAIAEQYLERQPDVILGGGYSHFDSNHRDDQKDLFSEFEKQDYSVFRNRKQLMEINTVPSKMLGTFYPGHLPYTLDHVNTPELLDSIPTLAEMTDIALQRLSQNRDGFILQVEGGRVDHAAHGNDLGGLLHDQIAFDDAIGVVALFAENRNDTLVIITTDHGNANPGFSSSPNENFDKVYEFNHSNSWIHSGISGDSTVSQVRERIEEATGIGVTRKEAEAYIQALNGEFEALYSRMSGRNSVLGQIIANYTDVNWVSTSHTADYVETTAYGPGSEALEGFIKNTDLFDVMTEAAGVTDYLQ